ncbi:hypothetical protein ATN84_15750 [Paramesorhizobium deserti]|uniref:Uncharacterized protein n=1 Tax=Paramesorhizobium deserti TaxID=1494590 RepID=A0A135HTG6_9HYPH|nr:hypothetical protein [Paramesorhizobium deserti]KXF76486.1 hypothetical protein ATN84_15750 [Paramesorhizobium deserti]
MVGNRKSDNRETESRRILDRVGRESTADHGMVARGVERTKKHLSAADADHADSIELWGTRIGRALALLLMAAAIIWLLVYIAGTA